MIDEKEADKASQWIYDNCVTIADAKASRVRAEEFLRVVRSEIQLTTEGTVAHKESTAFASDEYKAALEEYVKAVRDESFLQTKLKAAELKIDLFRSINANLRGLR